MILRSIKILLTCLYILPIVVYAQVDLTKGLVAYYPFNGNANDASGNGNNPVFNNAVAVAGKDGLNNTAYRFNGVNSYMQIPNSGNLNPSSNTITLYALVKPRGFYYGACHWSHILSKGSGDSYEDDGLYWMGYCDDAWQATLGSGACVEPIPDTVHQSFHGAFDHPSWGSGKVTSQIKKDTWYSYIITYDGTTIKYYLDCVLVDSLKSSNVIFNNTDDLFLGKHDSPYPYWFNGDIDEVRIYNRALNIDEVEALSPCSKSGIVLPSFTVPDTVCVNTPVTITNTSVGATTYNWSFCSGDFTTTPEAINLGNPGNLLSTPVFIDYAKDDNGDYYGFTVNYSIGTLIRLKYGKSLLNNPVADDLGNFGSALPSNSEGVQVVKANNQWYVILTTGGNVLGTASAIIRISFGASLANPSPVATNWGNIGNLFFPHDLFITKEGNNYYGFTVNVNSQTITRFDFGTDFTGVPTGVNLGNIGSLNYPCGFSFINTGGNWYAFIANRNSNGISRLNFGTSLLNTPTAVNLGNPGGFLQRPRDISLFQTCGGITGMVVNELNSTITKLDFGSNILSTPAATSLGNIGNLNFPHSISKFFIDNNDVYAFIPNVANNTLTRIRYKGCSIAGSSLQDPPPVTYTATGTYNINLLVDIGLPSQASFCKQILVKDCTNPISSIINDYTPVLALDKCSNKLTVTDASAFKVGDTVLMIQMKGAAIDSSNTASFGTITNYNSAGNYEFNYISAKAGNVLTLLNSLTRSYEILQGKVQLIRVPYYTSVAISSTLTCLPWDGSKGGVLVLNVKDSVSLNADIDVSGKGFTGGIDPVSNPSSFYCDEDKYYYPKDPDLASGKGEGIASVSDARSFGRGPLANGGGGGNSHNSGGGGGSNISAGGFGGYNFEGSPCDGIVPFDNRGINGKALIYNTGTNKIFMGGGGGAGHTNNPEAFQAVGGKGGGIVIVFTGKLTSNGRKIITNGTDAATCSGGGSGCHEGMGGGGAGGSVIMKMNTATDNTLIENKGGNGGDMTASGFLRVGPGGGGGGGVVWLSQASLPANISVKNTAGKNGVCTAYSNDPWGATSGTAGQNVFSLSVPFDNTLFKKNIDSIRFTQTLAGCNNYNFNGLSYTNTSPIVNWQWSFGDGGTANTQNTSHTYIANGTFTIKLIGTDANGCKDSASRQVIITIPKIDAVIDTTICAGAAVQLNVTGTGLQSFSWVPPTGLSSTTIANPLASPLDTTKYIVTATDINGCKAKDSVTINVVALPAVSTLADSAICSGSSIVLNTTGTGNSWSWIPPAGLNNAGIKSPVASPLVTTEYFVTAKTPEGCSAKDSVTITVKFLPSVAASGDTLICGSGQAQLNAFSAGAIAYSWVPPNGLDNSTIANPLASPNTTTKYVVTVQGVNGCSNKDSVVVSIYPKPIFDLTPSSASICSGKNITLTASGGDSYAWLPDATLSTTTGAVTVATPVASTVYTVNITESTCNESAMLTTTVTVLPGVNVNAEKLNDVDCFNNTVNLLATGAETFAWTPVTGLSNPNIANPVATPLSTTIYTVTGSNANGCSGSDTVTVKVDLDAKSGYYMADAFTPNGDGLNDCIGIRYWGNILSIEYVIYNRWGNEVFRAANASSCWDGTYRGTGQGSGTYVYYIKANTSCGYVYKEGTIVLIR